MTDDSTDSSLRARVEDSLLASAHQLPDPADGDTSVRLSDGLSDRILRFIVEEDLQQGARLPSERDLAERFGTSRPTMSQALRRLSLMGMVDIRRGSGVYVLRRPERMVTASVNLMLDLDRSSMDDLMDARLWLERVAVEQAALRPGRPDAVEARELTRALERLVEAHDTTARWIAADTVFHAAVVNLADNTFISAFYESVHTASLASQFEQWVHQDVAPDWLHATGPEEHRALHEPILAAVIAGDPAAARSAVENHHRVMLEHLDEATRSLR